MAKIEDNNRVDATYIRSLVERAYSCACAHGFHDEALSMEHFLMLAVSEVGEAVEADRCGRYVDWASYEGALEEYHGYADEVEHRKYCFRTYVKDTCGDELADVVIRLCDLCGVFGLDVRLDETDVCDADGFMEVFGEDSFCERCYYLTRLLCSGATCKLEDTRDDDCMPVVIGSAISFVFSMCACMGIDLKRHIEEKMWYNERMEAKHRKEY